nr:CotH kinase family protein [uncultured Gemmiger sp.]
MNRPWYKTVLAVLLPLAALAALLAAAAGRLAEAPGADGYAGATVLLNEVCAKNLTGITDADGNTGDWVELINVSGQDITLDGWGLSDDPDRPFRWTFPEGTVLGGGANNILLVFADGQDGYDGTNLHAKFSLSRSGETLVLTAPDGTTVDTLEYPAMEYDLPYGRLPGSADRVGVLTGPTPGAANSLDFLEETVLPADWGTVEFSAPAGFYEDEFQLTLSAADPDAVILYTLDGSVPDTDSPVYTGPISIGSRAGEKNDYASLPTVLHDGWLMGYAYRCAPDPVDKATTVTARLWKDGTLGEAVSVQTYWVGVDSGSLPVVSLTCEADDLFGPEGIYVAGQTYYTMQKYGAESPQGNFNGSEKVDGRLQILAPDGSDAWQGETTVRISGGWSRQGVQQKNLHLKLQDDATADILDAAPGGDALDTLVLRGMGNGTVYPALHQDAFLSNYLYDTDVGCQYNVPVTLFLQDEYWGVYTIRESKNADFFLRHYGIREKDLICPGTTDDETAQPEKSAFGLGVDALDATTAEGKAWVEANVDVDEYIRYTIAQMYTYNADGMFNGGNNSILWKSAKVDESNPYADGRWRFLLNDLDATMIDYEVDPFAYLLENDFSFENCENSPWYSVIDNLFQKLWQDPDFRQRFAAEFRAEMATTYAPENIGPAFDAWVDLLRPEVERDLARLKVETTPLAPLTAALTGVEANGWEFTMDDWDRQADIVSEYLDKRADVMLACLDRYLTEADGQ